MPTKALSRKNPSAPMFLDKGETTSAKFAALAIPSIDLCSKGTGVEVCHAITPEEEDKL